jgi:hypothetical protein
VRHSRGDHEAGRKGDAGQVVGASSEGSEDFRVGDFEDLGGDKLASFEEVLDDHLVLEGENLQLVEKGGLGGVDSVIGDNDSDGVNDLDLSSDNLGLDVEGLEESSLLRVHAGGTCGNDDILGGEGTDLGGSLSDLGVEDLFDGGEISVGEDEASVANELVSDDRKLGTGLPDGLSFLVVVVDSLVGLNLEVGNGGLHVSVLSHDHLGVDGTELLSHDANLLGSNVVDFDEEALVVLKESFLEFGPTGRLHLLLSSLGHLVVFISSFYYNR